MFRPETADERFVKHALLVLAFLAVITAGCRTTVRRNLAIPPNSGPRTAAPARAWEIRSEGSLVGHVVYFEAHGPTQDSLYMVRNIWHQDLGMIDGFGRAFRYVPHHEEAAWVGSGTVVLGVERILGRSGCRLAEIPLPGEPRPNSPGVLEQRRMSLPNPLSGDS